MPTRQWHNGRQRAGVSMPGWNQCRSRACSTSTQAKPQPCSTVCVTLPNEVTHHELKQEQQSMATSRRTLLTGAFGMSPAIGWAAASQAASTQAVQLETVAAEAATAEATASVAAPVSGQACGNPTGITALRDPYLNRGLATPDAARAALQLEGLLPAAVTDLDTEILRARAALSRATNPLDQYQVLMSLREQNAQCFYTLLQEHTAEFLPMVYTPAVADACLSWGTLLPRPTGLYISYQQHKGRVQEVVNTWPEAEVMIAVITDGERILGLGDLGAHGMGIPIGKSVVYGASGLDARWVLPVCVDVGCNNNAVRDDPLYVGNRQPRLPDTEYYSFMGDVVNAIQARYGRGVLIHWEDVGSQHSFSLLQQLREQGMATFNDDIQATAAVTVAALLGAVRVPGVLPLVDQTFLFFGAGQASLGVAQLLAAALEDAGLSALQARQRIWLMDKKGLLLTDRTDLSVEKLAFAQHPSSLGAGHSLLSIIEAVQPTTLIGAASVAGAFDQQVVQAMVAATEQRAKEARRSTDNAWPGAQQPERLFAADCMDITPRARRRGPEIPSLLFASAQPEAALAASQAQGWVAAGEHSAFRQPQPHLGVHQAASQADVRSRHGVDGMRVRPPSIQCVSSDGVASTVQPVLLNAHHTRRDISQHVSMASTNASIGVTSDSAATGAWSAAYAPYPPSARPVILALSNPTNRAECSFADAYAWSGGRVVYASGSPFPALQVDAVTREPISNDNSSSSSSSGPVATLMPAQCNNCYVFPGIGLGSIAMGTGAMQVTQNMLLAASYAVAGAVSQEELQATECVLPPISKLGDLTIQVAAAVATAAVTDTMQLVTGAGARPAASQSAEAEPATLPVSYPVVGVMGHRNKDVPFLVRQAALARLAGLRYNARKSLP